MFGFGASKDITKTCKYCGEKYKAPEFGEVMFTHLSFCVPYRMKDLKDQMKLQSRIEKYEDEHQKQLIREVLKEAGIIPNEV